MIVQGQKPVCESVAIIEYMDQHFKGKNQLMQGQSEAVKAKYQTLKQMHEKWDVESFTFGTAMGQNFYISQMLPFFWMKDIDGIKALQQKEPTLK